MGRQTDLSTCIQATPAFKPPGF